MALITPRTSALGFRSSSAEIALLSTTGGPFEPSGVDGAGRIELLSRGGQARGADRSLGDDAVQVEERPDVVLKGKSGAVSLFAVQA